MKTGKISSAYTLKEVSVKTEELKRSIQRISSGKIRNPDSPTGVYLSSLIKDKVEKLDFISQHITKSVNTLQNYEEVLSSVISSVEDMKLIVERATQVNDPDEFRKLEKAYTERFLALKENIRKATFLGKSIALGGYSNSVSGIKLISGSIDVNPPDLNVSGINFRIYGVEESGSFQIRVKKNGNTVQANLEVNGSTVATQTKDILIDNFPNTVDFEEIGFSINVSSKEDFEILVDVKAEPLLVMFGEGENDFEKFFLPPLDPESLGLKMDLSEGADVNLGRIKEALKFLSETKGKIGEKMQNFETRSDMNSVIQAKHKILGSFLSETDMPSESVILSLKQNILQADSLVLQRAIAMVFQAVEMLRR